MAVTKEHWDHLLILVAAIITAIPPLINVFLTRRVKHDVSTLKLQINSRMEEFITLIRKEAHAAGMVAGRKEAEKKEMP